MLTCTVCSERFRPPWSSAMREEDAVCPACFEANFAGDALRQEPYAPTLYLTPRQVDAMRRVVVRVREEHRRG